MQDVFSIKEPPLAASGVNVNIKTILEMNWKKKL